MMYRQGKNAICVHLFGLKYRIYSFVEAALYELKWRRVKTRCVLFVFGGFLTFRPFEINFDCRKSLVFVQNLKEKGQNFYLTHLISLFSAANSLLSCSCAVMASKL